MKPATTRQQLFERINKNRQSEENLDESLIEPSDLNKQAA